MQQNQNIETILESIGSLEFSNAKVIQNVVEIGANMFQSNLLKVQEYLQYIAEFVDKDKDEP